MIALLPIAAHAEVMDKEFSLVTVLLLSFFGALAAFLAARLKPWLLLIVMPAIGMLSIGHLAEVLDPFVGATMASEAGQLYIIVSWGALLLILFGAALGLVFRSRHVRVHT